MLPTGLLYKTHKIPPDYFTAKPKNLFYFSHSGFIIKLNKYFYGEV